MPVIEFDSAVIEMLDHLPAAAFDTDLPLVRPAGVTAFGRHVTRGGATERGVEEIHPPERMFFNARELKQRGGDR